MDSIHLPNAITLPNTFGAPGVPLPPGQVLQALVLALIERGVFRLQLPQATVDVRSDVRLTPGNTVTLAVKRGGASTKLVIYSDSLETPALRGQGALPSLAGRYPIGEAVVIARAPLPPFSPARVPAPVEPPLHVVRPEQAISDAIRAAAPRQSGLAPLFANIERVMQLAAPLPPAVRTAAVDVLSLRVPLDEQLAASNIKLAFQRSGILFESRLAAQPPPAAASDLKAALLVLRQVLKVWSAAEPQPSRMAAPAAPKAVLPEMAATPASPAIDDVAIKHLASALAGTPDETVPKSRPLSPEQATSLAKSIATALTPRDGPTPQQALSPNNGPPPPYRGAPLAVQPPLAASVVLGGSPHDMAKQLLTQTDGSLARQTLLQIASFPEQPDGPRGDAAQRWSFETPFATPQGTAIAQFEISRDGRTPKSDPQVRTWRARFSLDVEPMGPVHASIALSGGRTSVMLWAERATTVSRLQNDAGMLSEALRAAELEPGDLQLRLGAPPAVQQTAPGRFMDRAS